METIEQRVQALEQENAARKQAEELLTISVRALASKEVFEKMQETVKESQEQNGRLFNVLINQGSLHNERLTDLQGQVIDLNGDVKKLQAETRQRFAEQNSKITALQTTQASHTALLKEHTSLLKQILERLPEKPAS